jgi:nitrogen regulatory protein PII
MKLVVAIVRPERLDAVQGALRARGIDQMTVTNVAGAGHQRGSSLIYRSITIQEKLLARVKLEIAVDEAMTDTVVEAIELQADTGEVGDGVILIQPVEELIRIGSGRSRRLNGKASNGPMKVRFPPSN